MLAQEPTLTKADRCDATCGAAAMVRVTTATLGEFLFCGHHWDIAKKNLPGVVKVHDERNPLMRPEVTK
jgi:hypothetical protein